MKENKKVKLSQEQIEAAREKWRLKNPELAEKRRQKALQVINESKEEVEQENHSPLKEEHDEDQKDLLRRRRIETFKHSVWSKREQFLLDREELGEDVAREIAKLSDMQLRAFKIIVKRLYNNLNQNLQPYGISLVIEGLRYPDKRISLWCYHFMEEQIRENKIYWAFWIGIWQRRFVPSDICRLMLKEEDGCYQPRPELAELMEVWFMGECVRKNLSREYERLEQAKSIENLEERAAQVTRKEKRIAYFKALLAAYNLQ